MEPLRLSTSLEMWGGDTGSQSYCSRLSNTVSGRIEIFSFLSGQLYSFGSLDCKTGTHLRTVVQKFLLKQVIMYLVLNLPHHEYSDPEGHLACAPQTLQ